MKGGGGRVEGGEIRSRRQLMPSVWILSSISARNKKSIKCPSLFVSVRVLQTQQAAWALSKVCRVRFCCCWGKCCQGFAPLSPLALGTPQAPSHPPPQTHPLSNRRNSLPGRSGCRAADVAAVLDRVINWPSRAAQRNDSQTRPATGPSKMTRARDTQRRRRRSETGGAVDVSGLYNTHSHSTSPQQHSCHDKREPHRGGQPSDRARFPNMIWQVTRALPSQVVGDGSERPDGDGGEMSRCTAAGSV